MEGGVSVVPKTSILGFDISIYVYFQGGVCGGGAISLKFSFLYVKLRKIVLPHPMLHACIETYQQ